MSKCRHKRVVLAEANDVVFFPDQEPFKEGVIEDCGIDEIVAESVTIHWCPKCHTAKCIDADKWHSSND